jgi:peptidylprolyl isomerase
MPCGRNKQRSITKTQEDNMAQAQQNDTVRVHYTGKLEDGTVFDTSREREPLEFTLGQGAIIPGFEEAVVGMEPGQTKTEVLTPEKAYGPFRDELVITIEREQFPEDATIEVGQRFEASGPQGPMILSVVDVEGDQVTADANHPLAGKALVFEIDLVEIV